MAIVPSSERIMDPRKLPMEEMLVTARAMGNTLLDENDEGFIIVCENFVARHMQRVFLWDFVPVHNNLGHKFSVLCSYESRDIPQDLSRASNVVFDYHSPYYKLGRYKNLDDMGTYLLRDLIYLVRRGTKEIGDHLLYRDKVSVDLFEGATYLELCEDEWVDE